MSPPLARTPAAPTVRASNSTTDRPWPLPVMLAVRVPTLVVMLEVFCARRLSEVPLIVPVGVVLIRPAAALRSTVAKVPAPAESTPSMVRLPVVSVRLIGPLTVVTLSFEIVRLSASVIVSDWPVEVTWADRPFTEVMSVELAVATALSVSALIWPGPEIAPVTLRSTEPVGRTSMPPVNVRLPPVTRLIAALAPLIPAAPIVRALASTMLRETPAFDAVSVLTAVLMSAVPLTLTASTLPRTWLTAIKAISVAVSETLPDVLLTGPVPLIVPAAALSVMSLLAVALTMERLSVSVTVSEPLTTAAFSDVTSVETAALPVELRVSTLPTIRPLPETVPVAFKPTLAVPASMLPVTMRLPDLMEMLPLFVATFAEPIVRPSASTTVRDSPEPVILATSVLTFVPSEELFTAVTLSTLPTIWLAALRVMPPVELSVTFDAPALAEITPVPVMSPPVVRLTSPAMLSPLIFRASVSTSVRPPTVVVASMALMVVVMFADSAVSVSTLPVMSPVTLMSPVAAVSVTLAEPALMLPGPSRSLPTVTVMLPLLVVRPESMVSDPVSTTVSDWPLPESTALIVFTEVFSDDASLAATSSTLPVIRPEPVTLPLAAVSVTLPESALIAPVRTRFPPTVMSMSPSLVTTLPLPMMRLLASLIVNDSPLPVILATSVVTFVSRDEARLAKTLSTLPET